MNFALLLPPEALAWLVRYGLFSVEIFLAALVLALLLRPFVQWYTGRAEMLERLRRLDETSRKALFELEMLNETLSVPIKKAAQKAKAAERSEKVQEPLVVSEATKADFLKALEKSRSDLGLGRSTPPDGPTGG